MGTGCWAASSERGSRYYGRTGSYSYSYSTLLQREGHTVVHRRLAGRAHVQPVEAQHVLALTQGVPRVAGVTRGEGGDEDSARILAQHHLQCMCMPCVCRVHAVHTPCMRRAYTVRVPCVCRACAVCVPCARAHAVHMLCTCRAHAVHTPCACRVYAVRMPPLCTCTCRPRAAAAAPGTCWLSLAAAPRSPGGYPAAEVAPGPHRGAAAVRRRHRRWRRRRRQWRRQRRRQRWRRRRRVRCPGTAGARAPPCWRRARAALPRPAPARPHPRSAPRAAPPGEG